MIVFICEQARKRSTRSMISIIYQRTSCLAESLKKGHNKAYLNYLFIVYKFFVVSIYVFIIPWVSYIYILNAM